MKYIIYLYIGQVIKGLTFILTREKIGIIKTADLTLMLVLYNYLLYSHIGLRFSVDKELPILYHNKKEVEIFEYKSKILVGVFFLQFMVSIVCYFFLKDKINYIVIILVSSLFLSLNETNKIFDRAKQDYQAYSKYTLFYNLMIGIIPYIGALYFSLAGIIVSYLLINIFFLFLYFPKNIKIIFDSKFILRKIKENIIFYLINIITFSFLNFDKLIINNFLNKKDLGNYSIASMFFSFLILLPNGLSEIIFPKLVVLIKNEKLSSKRTNILLKRNIEVVYLMNVCFIFILPYFIKIFFKNFQENIFIIQLISVNILYYGAVGILSYIILARKKEIVLLKKMVRELMFFLIILIILIIYTKRIEVVPFVYIIINILLLKDHINILEKENLINKDKIILKYVQKQIILIALCFFNKINAIVSVLLFIYILYKWIKINNGYVQFILKKLNKIKNRYR